MNAYFVTCTGFEKDEDGNVTVVHCTYDPETKSGSGFTGRKVKGTIHWVEASTALPATVRLYENLIDEEKGVYNKEEMCIRDRFRLIQDTVYSLTVQLDHIKAVSYTHLDVYKRQERCRLDIVEEKIRLFWEKQTDN